MKNAYLTAYPYTSDFQIHSNTDDIGFVINQDYQGLDSPEVRLSSYNKPGQSGAVVSNQLYGGRQIHLPGRISGSSPAEYQIRRRTLQNLLRVIKDKNGVSQPVLFKFKTMDNLELQTYVYTKDPLQLINKSLTHCAFLLSLYSDDPNLYSQSLSTYSLNLPTSTGLIYPATYPVHYPSVTGGQITVNNAGDANTPLTITFNGPLTSPFVTNITTGETFAINLTLGAGEKLLVTMKKNSMLLNDTSNGLQYFVLTNTWMELVPGDNVLKIGTALSSDLGSALINFRSAYLGE